MFSYFSLNNCTKFRFIVSSASEETKLNILEPIPKLFEQVQSLQQNSLHRLSVKKTSQVQ